MPAAIRRPPTSDCHQRRSLRAKDARAKADGGHEWQRGKQIAFGRREPSLGPGEDIPALDILRVPKDAIDYRGRATFDADQQFGPSNNLQINNAEMLCVPSNKREATLPTSGWWGTAALIGLLMLTTVWYGQRQWVRDSPA